MEIPNSVCQKLVYESANGELAQKSASALKIRSISPPAAARRVNSCVSALIRTPIGLRTASIRDSGSQAPS